MTPNSSEPPVNIPGAAFIGRENILPHYRTERHLHAEDSLAWNWGRHTLKAGGDILMCPATIEYHRLTNGLFTFGPQPPPGAPAGSPVLTPVQAYGLGQASHFVQQFGNPRGESGKTSAGTFVQDSWRADPRLTLDFGVRYDVETTNALQPGSERLRPVYELLGILRSPVTDKDNLQPRVGLACQVVGQGRLTLRASYGLFYDRLLNLATWLAAVGDGNQITRIILPAAEATAVFRSPLQKLTEFPGAAVSTGLIAFSKDWQLGQSQQANVMLSSHIRNGLTVDAGYVWGKGTHLARSRDINPPDSGAAAGFLFGGGTQQDLLALNFFRPVPQVSEVMSFEGSACSSYHGMRLALRGRVGQRLSVNSSYTFSKAIDDAEEIFPHSRAQDMRNLRAERGLALYDQRQRFVFAAVLDLGEKSLAGSLRRALQNGWTIAPMLEFGSGRPLNILLGYDNNLDQEPGSDRPHVALGTEPGAVWTQYGGFAVPPAGVAGNLGRNAVVGPGYASFALRLQKKWRLCDRATAALVVDGLNIFNRTNVRASNPNFQHAGEPVAAFDPRQIQVGLRLEF